MSGATPFGAAGSVRSVTSRMLDMLIAARITPLGASFESAGPAAVAKARARAALMRGAISAMPFSCSKY